MMKKALTFLIVCCCFILWPPPRGTAQNDSIITKKDFKILDKKDSSLSVKIDSQLQTVKQQISEILKSKQERIVKFRTVVKRHVRTDSFYVLVDTCFSKTNFIKYLVHDTIWIQKEVPRDNFFNRLFHKKERKDEIKVIQ